MIVIKGIQETSLLRGFTEHTRAIKQSSKESDIDFAEIFNNEVSRLKGVNTVENHENSD